MGPKDLLDLVEKYPKAVALGLFACLVSGTLGGGLYVASLKTRIEGQSETSQKYEGRLKGLEDAHKNVAAQLKELRRGFDAHTKTTKETLSVLGSLPKSYKMDPRLAGKIEEVRLSLSSDIGHLELALEKADAVASAFSSFMAARSIFLKREKVSPEIRRQYRSVQVRLASARSLGEVHGAHSETVRLLRALHADEEILAASLNNLGLSYGASGEYSQALESFNEALAILEGTRNRGDRATVAGNAGSLLLKKGDPDRAEAYLQAALAVVRTTEPASANHALLLERFGKLRELQQRNQEARSYYEKALNLYGNLSPSELAEQSDLVGRYIGLLRLFGELEKATSMEKMIHQR